jgi:hypothetical protein
MGSSRPMPTGPQDVSSGICTHVKYFVNVCDRVCNFEEVTLSGMFKITSTTRILWMSVPA